MPQFDGTGPRGEGPMTGGARGYCMMRVPRTPREPVAGLAGVQGTPVTTASFSPREQELDRLRMQAAYLENALILLSRRIDYLREHAQCPGVKGTQS